MSRRSVSIRSIKLAIMRRRCLWAVQDTHQILVQHIWGENHHQHRMLGEITAAHEAI